MLSVGSLHLSSCMRSVRPSPSRSNSRDMVSERPEAAFDTHVISRKIKIAWDARVINQRGGNELPKSGNSYRNPLSPGNILPPTLIDLAPEEQKECKPH